MSQQTEQALLQLIESLLITALITGIISASAAIATNGSINWQLVGFLFGTSFLFSLGHGVAAYFKTVPDSQEAQLGVVIDALITALEKRYPPLQGGSQDQTKGNS
jgi:hypothetical protein